MSVSAPMNFRYYSGPVLEQDEMLAADTQKWEAGAPGYYNSSGLADPIATDEVNVDFLFAEQQDTNTSTSTVKILKIPGASTKFVGYTSTDAADVAASQSDVGQDHGIQVGNNGDSEEVATVNTNETSAVAVHIDALMSTKEPEKHAAGDDPGQVIFHFLQSVLDA